MIKQILFFLFVAISIKGYSQESVIVKAIGLEVMKNDLGKMSWDEAVKICKKSGVGWRLPTIEELKKIYTHKDLIGNFNGSYYWSSTEYYFYRAYFFLFEYGIDGKDIKEGKYSVRAVRDL